MRMRSAKSRRSAVRPVYRVYAQVTTQSTSVAPEEEHGRGPQGARGVVLHALVQTLLDEEGARQRQERVDHDQPEADEEGAAVGTQERPEPEVLAPRGLGGDVDVGLVVGRWQRVDRGQQLRRGSQRDAAAGAARGCAAAPEAASRHCGPGRCDEGAHPLGLGGAVPQRRGDAAGGGRVRGRGSTTSSSSRSSPGPWSSARYSGDDASSSSWVPLSATRPSATSTMRSARRRVERRWAMSTVVRSAMISRSVAWICSSVRVSTDDVASSSTSTRGSVSTARAMEMRWR